MIEATPTAANPIALKEWSSVCAAIRTGRQVLLFRTGGISEETDGFHLQYPEFWLFPTRFHEADVLIDPNAVAQFRCESIDHQSEIPIQDYCRVERIFFVDDLQLLTKLSRWHILAESVIESRFQYRNPGLYVLILRAYRRIEATMVPRKAEYDGCKSWVELEHALPVDQLGAVITNEVFDQMVADIESVLLVHQ